MPEDQAGVGIGPSSSIPLAQAFVPEAEQRLARLIGDDRITELRADLAKILSGLHAAK